MKKLLFIILTILFAQNTVVAQIQKSEFPIKISNSSNSSILEIIKNSSENSYLLLLKTYNKGQFEPIDNRKIAYTISSYTIDCDNFLYKIGTIDSYSIENDFITGDYNKYAKFQPIVTGSDIGEISNKLCKVQ